MLINTFKRFMRLESASGLLLIAAALFAMLLSNSPLAHYYNALLQTHLEIRLGAWGINKPLLLWINDGLMAGFFLLVGMEIKREVLDGELSDPSQIALPGIAAVGGMLVPALFYIALNYHDPRSLAGWAIPTATDIAFALGVLMLLGKRVPSTLKLFLLTLAIFDDLGAIIIIALFYTAQLSTTSLIVAASALAVLIAFNVFGVRRLSAYLAVGLILWVSVLKSGVHATLAGVVLGLCIPLRSRDKSVPSPLHRLEDDLHPLVAYGILPIFAFANAGLSFKGMGLNHLLAPISLGIIAALFLGKQIGIFGFSALAIGLGLAKRPKGVSWMALYGVSVLCGIGFTMSLFIASLAFESSGHGALLVDRLGIVIGSLLSAVLGYLILRRVLPRTPEG